MRSYNTTAAGNPRVTGEVTRDVVMLSHLMAANLYISQIEDLMFEVQHCLVHTSRTLVHHTDEGSYPGACVWKAQGSEWALRCAEWCVMLGLCFHCALACTAVHVARQP